MLVSRGIAVGTDRPNLGAGGRQVKRRAEREFAGTQDRAAGGARV
jgi:hypothetical protein